MIKSLLARSIRPLAFTTLAAAGQAERTKARRGRHEPFTARLRSVPIPSITTSMVSPALNARVVPGVPV